MQIPSPTLLFLSVFLTALSACTSETPPAHQAGDYLIIPRPQQLQAGAGYFEWGTGPGLDYDQNNDQLKTTVDYFQERLQQLNIPTLQNGENTKNNLKLNLDNQLPPGGYTLTITAKGILIQGGDAAGIFYGFQTLLQLIEQQLGGTKMEIPCVHIQDQPAFAHRGLMLDVSRHFFPVDFVKKYIDLMAQYKMNRFHWHLTDDQGWRIEIKRYPKLQTVAAYREETLVGHYNDQPQRYDGQRYGGYYTQEEVKEIIAYAKERFVTIIPEIEMPGHARAALAAYPELSCTGGPIQVGKKWGIHEEVYCPTDTTFAFLENVLTEVFELFDSEYIHIGGDECPKTRWEESRFCQDLMQQEGLKNEEELQSYFINRIERFVNSKGRRIIGWDEILEGGLAPNATVMSWRGEEGGIEAAQSGHDVIMSPTSHCYLDYYQSQHPDEPLAIGGYLPLEKVYGYHPVPEALNSEEAKHVLGAQGNLWTEYIPTPEKAEYMVFPRALAIAELTWTKQERKDFNDFTRRLQFHIQRLQSAGVNVANPLAHVTASVQSGDGEGVKVAFSNLASSTQIYYTTDGSDPSPASSRYTVPIEVKNSGTYRAQAFEGNKAAGREANCSFELHLAAGAKISLSNMPAEKYGAGGPGAVINGLTGSNERYGDKEWLGFEGTDFEAVIDLGEPQPIHTVSFRFFNGPGQWIYPPKEVNVAWSTDGSNYSAPASAKVEVSDQKIATASLDINIEAGKTSRYLSIKVPNYGLIPKGKQGGGNRAWLFVDEIVVN